MSARPRPSTLYLLNQASQAMRSRLEVELRAEGVTGIQYTILALLGEHHGLSSSDLSRRFYVTPQTMNEIIAGLARRELIIREEDPDNRRILRMKLSPLGRKVLTRCDRMADGIQDEGLSQLSGEQLSVLRSTLQLLLKSLRQKDLEKAAGRPVPHGSNGDTISNETKDRVQGGTRPVQKRRKLA